MLEVLQKEYLAGAGAVTIYNYGEWGMCQCARVLKKHIFLQNPSQNQSISNAWRFTQ